MTALQIDFEDGFRNDVVVVRANGRELWRADNVTTNLSSNVAAIASIDVPSDAELEVLVPSRGLRAAAQVASPFLVVRMNENVVELTPAEAPPPHL